MQELTKQVAFLEASNSTTKGQVVVLERSSALKDGEKQALGEGCESLKAQVQESDEALAEAVRSNEALREQMELQRLDAQTTNERDLHVSLSLLRDHEMLDCFVCSD